jgi:hypothetical protein
VSRRLTAGARLGWLLASLLVLAVTAVPATSAVSPTPAPEASRPPADKADSDGDGLRDAVELAWGITDPWRADSDGDGLIDAAEDADGDGLGALGEQRFGTDAGLADSDGDGIRDGDEDSDGDGVSNANQQDRRRVPVGLRPTLEMAWWDRASSYDDRCHSDAVDPELRTCSFGDLDGDVSIAVLGDSHALQWLPALVAAAEGEGWRVTTLTKAACPPAQVDFGRKEPGAAASCDAWRADALAWLAEQPPDLLLMTGAGRVYNILGADGQPLAEDDALASWQRGLAATLGPVAATTRVVVLADTPLMRRNPVSCLEDSPGDMSACQTPRSAALGDPLDTGERETAEAAGAVFESLSDLVCPYDPCPVVIGDVLLWRNADHITATFAESLAPAMGALVERHLPPPIGD